MATIASAGPAAVRSRFYVHVAIFSLVVAFVGFLPTYWIPMVRGTLEVNWIAHVHGVLFYGWLFFYWKQASLAASGNMARHRELGVAGVALATAGFVVAIGTAMGSVRQFDALGMGTAGRNFFIIPVTQALLFAGFVTGALLNTRNPEVHKRLMLVATTLLLIVAFGRMFAFFLAPIGVKAPPPVVVTFPPGILCDLMIVAAMVRDRLTLGRVHRVYWIALPICLAVQLIRIPLSGTEAWAAATVVLMKFAPLAARRVTQTRRRAPAISTSETRTSIP